MILFTNLSSLFTSYFLIQYQIHLFFIRTKLIRKWGSNGNNPKETRRLNFQNFSASIGQESTYRRYSIQNAKDGIQIQAYNINNGSLSHLSQFISVKVKKNLRNSQAKFREKLRKLILRQNDGFLTKKRVNYRKRQETQCRLRRSLCQGFLCTLLTTRKLSKFINSHVPWIIPTPK